MVVLMFFFFQAEDGIRDYKVTGVQTCALPILTEKDRKSVFWTGSGYEMATLGKKKDLERLRLPSASLTAGYGCGFNRSTQIGRASCRERCRSRWSPYH